MANKRTISIDLLAKNKTGPGFRSAGNDAQALGRTMAAAGAAAAAGLAVAGAAAVAFGVSSVKAFAEAEEAQNRLAFAFEKFPALADTSIQALQRLNSALMKKTRFDDDAIASGQAVLAQFGLTGSQLERLTPLLLDYATRTGKDLTESAQDLGRALLGQGRALKILGIDFKDTGSTAGNFDQLVRDLDASVGGLAETAATTAAGKLDMLKNRFGEVQETIGAALMPALDKLLAWMEGDGLRALEGFAKWFAEDGIDAVSGFVDTIADLAEDGTLVPNIIAGMGAITAAQWAMNAAMAANPVGLVIAGIVALIALGVAIVANWNSISKVIFSVTAGITKGIGQIVVGVASGVQSAINTVLGGLRVLLGPVNALLGMLGLGGVSLPSSVNFTRSLSAFVNGMGQVADAGALGGTDYLFGGGFGGGAPSGSNAVRPGRVVAMAEGGIVRPTPGGTRAVIGEAGTAEAVIPLTARNLAMMGGGGSGVHVTINGFVGTSKDQVAQAIVRVIEDAKRSGAVRAGALA